MRNWSSTTHVVVEDAPTWVPLKLVIDRVPVEAKRTDRLVALKSLPHVRIRFEPDPGLTRIAT